MEDNPSGQAGLLGKVADWFDRKPVKGWGMTTAVKVVGAVLVASAAVTGTVKVADSGDDRACATEPLRNVYRPSRLKVVDTCVRVTGTVIAWRHEHDGDYHVSVKMDEPGWVNDLNIKGQHGFTVVEFIPGDPRPKFKVGQRLELLGTKVLDLQHGNHKTTGWLELHPVYEVREVTTLPKAIQPINEPQLAPPTEKG